ncbi:MAG TPA: alpha/beta hydrolase [Candidatus Limnocylindria bacterium]
MLVTREWPPVLPADGAADAAAPVAVLVHGVTGWHRTWWRVAPALAAHGWRVVAVDQRGHGHSPRIDGIVTIRDFASDLEATIAAMGDPIDLLLGHSLGGVVAVELAVARPDLVRRLVLEDPPTISRAVDVAWLDNLERELAAATEDFDGEVARTRELNPIWLEEDARQDVEGKTLADGRGLVDSFRADVGARVLDRLTRLEVPTLLILAAEGRSVFTADARQQLSGRLPDGVRQVVIDAGHTIHRDRFDEYVATILDWSGGPSASS